MPGRKTWSAGEKVNASDLNSNFNLFRFGGDGSDGALSISSGTTTIDLGGAAVFVKNYTSISITGTGKLAFTNPHANGTHIIIKSQGDVTLTSSTVPLIDVSGMGADGGAAVSVGASSSSDGNSGSLGQSEFFKTNQGLFASGSTPGNGGAIATGRFVFLSKYLAKYPFSFVGAGGASGSVGNTSLTGTASSGGGGKGGGALLIECAGSLNITGTIYAKGSNGGNGSYSNSDTVKVGGGGGGGGGGFIAIIYNALTADTGTYTVTGGTGGNLAANAGGTSKGGGGGGASRETAGSNGTASSTDGTKTGGDGATGTTMIIKNTEFA
jgi:hypothetical protein